MTIPEEIRTAAVQDSESDHMFRTMGLNMLEEIMLEDADDDHPLSTDEFKYVPHKGL